MIYFNSVKILRSILLAVFILGLATLAFAGSDYYPGSIIVRFKPGVVKIPKGLTVAAARAASVSAASVKTLGIKYAVANYKKIYQAVLAKRPDWKQLEDDYLLTFPDEKGVINALNDFKNDPNVVWAYPNTRVRAFQTIPNDPYYSVQWGLPKMAAPAGWDRSTGSAANIVAVLDTGLDYNHEEFVGRVDRVHEKNYVVDPINGDGDPMDDYGHGTAVAGVIAATGNNAKGVAGMDWKCKILPIKILDSGGGGSIESVVKALAYLTALKAGGVNIVAANMSLGQYNSAFDPSRYTEENPAGLKERCQAAYDQGIVLIAAAGNGNVDWNTYPAYYPSVVAVAATDTGDLRSVWGGTDPETGKTQASNYASWVDVSAPGTNIKSTDHHGTYTNPTVPGGEYWNGTSLASPYVAGLASLIKAAKPSLTNVEIINRIQFYADNIDSLQDPAYAGKLGSGRINAQKALTGLTAEITSPEAGAYIKGLQGIYGTATGWDFNNYQLEVLSGETVVATVETSAVSIEAGLLGTWDTDGMNGPYTIDLKVFAADLISREARSAVIVDNISPEVSISYPDSATVEGTVTITGTAADQNFDHYILEYAPAAAPASFQHIATAYLPVSTGALGSWETAGLLGDFLLRLTAYDKVGLMNSTITAVSITSATPTREVGPAPGLPMTFSLPNPFIRTGTGATSEVVLYYNLKGNFNTTIYLFDLNGNLIWRKLFLAGDNGGKAGDNSPPWDGKTLFGEAVANGVYVYQVTTGSSVIAKGKVIVLN